MVPSWLKFCARGLFCSLKEIRRIKGTFAENWHFLLEVVRTDGRALAVESRCFLFKALPSALLPSTCLPLSPRPPQGARATLESGPWCASWQGGGPGSPALLVLLTVHPLGMHPKHVIGRAVGRGQGHTRCPGSCPSSSLCRLWRVCQGHPGRPGGRRRGFCLQMLIPGEARVPDAGASVCYHM